MGSEETPDENYDVSAWRYEQLRLMGFNQAVATSMAIDPTLDIGALRELLRHGCPLDLAERIVA